MKKSVMILLGALLCVCLGGCSQLPPLQAADGAQWSEDWVTIGNVIGVDTPEGAVLLENNTTLDLRGMYYAAWTIGEETPYVNADGEDASVYDAQYYLLLAGFDAVSKAEDALTEWRSMAASQYSVEETTEAVYNGQSFTVMTYTYRSADNPYQRGASAFGLYRNYAVSVELSCREGFDGDARTLLAGLLERCHYAV